MSGDSRWKGCGRPLCALWLALVVLGTGCGPLADGKYYGEPLFSIEGVVQADEELDVAGEVGVALLWSNESVLDAGAQAVLVETRFPARYRLKVFQPPAAETVLATVGGVPVEASVGQILLFGDDDGDGVWNPEQEALVGGAYNAAVLYVPGADEGEGSAALPVDWQPEPGFHLMSKEPGPVGGRTWEEWMEPANPTGATLHVGYYGGLGVDWDCDGEEDFADDIFQPGLDNGLECAPAEVLDDECAEAALLADEVEIGALGPSSLEWLLAWHEELASGCHAQVCPDEVGRLGELLGWLQDDP